MKLFNLIALLAICHSSFANSGKPVTHNFSKKFIATLREFKYSPETAKSSKKVCSCQILSVESNNEQMQYIAIFAQKTHSGNLSSDYSHAKNILHREKKYLENQFFTRVQLKENLKAETDCSLLYKSIKARYNDIRMYSMLDADVLSKIRK